MGSTNFDNRSFRLNDEASLNLFAPDFAAHMRKVFEKDLQDADQVTLDAWRKRPWTQRLREWIVIPVSSQF